MNNDKEDKKKIILDLLHIPHINFFKNFAIKFRNVGEITIVFRPRGIGTNDFRQILLKEYPKISCKEIGSHKNSILTKVYGTISRELKLLNYLKNKRVDATVGISADIPPIAKILSIPSLAFYDDFEYREPFYRMQKFATRFVIPASIPISKKNIIKYRGFKELAYLHPNYFEADVGELKKYNLKPNEYIFIRDVSNIALNYKYYKRGKMSEISNYLADMGYKVLLSLEDKSYMKYFGENCILLKEPVNDIYSLMAYAALTISSGDTLARESCLVGTPTIYTGGRDMIVNKELIDLGAFFKIDDKEKVIAKIKEMIENDKKKEIQGRIEKLIKRCDDTTQVILDNLLSLLYNDDSYIEKYKQN